MKELRPVPHPRRIKSKALTDSARGKSCTLRLRDCEPNDETVCFCHVRINSGTGTKPPDFFGFYGCRACHRKQEIGFAPHYEILRAVLETQTIMASEGLLTVKGWSPR
jgi:hypothetical protein